VDIEIFVTIITKDFYENNAVLIEYCISMNSRRDGI